VGSGDAGSLRHPEDDRERVSGGQVREDHDPFAPVEASPRGATLLAMVGFVAAAASVVTGLAPVSGPLGMGLGVVAHTKGSRLGMPAAVASGSGMIVGFAITFWLR
jgi:hypothetical protein